MGIAPEGVGGNGYNRRVIPMFRILVFLAMGCAATLSGNPRLPPVFGDHMVLQRGREIPVWGWAEPGERITVSLGGKSRTTMAGREGRWKTLLPKHAAAGPYELRVEGNTVLTISDVLIGEVWVYAGEPPDEAAEDASGIRVYRARVGGVPGTWRAVVADSLFARELHEQLTVPIGVVVAAVERSTAEEWVTPEFLRKDATFAPILERWRSGITKRAPGGQFQALIAPLIPFAVRGVVWRQGETNVKRAYQYRKLLPALIESWRYEWRQEKLPFVIVQLPSHGPPRNAPGESAWAELREAQSLALSAPDTGLVVTIGAENSDEAHRMALVALGMAYGKRVSYSGPVYKKMKRERGRLRIEFNSTGGGLLARGGEPLRGFTIAGSDGQFYQADATIRGKAVVISSPRAPDPVAVRYSWADSPDGNLYNREGLPAVPFRTDDWPGITMNER